MINKKTKIKIITQLLIGVSTVGLGVGCNNILNQPIKAYASEVIGLQTNNLNIKEVYNSYSETYVLKNDGTVWFSGKSTSNYLNLTQVPITNVQHLNSTIGNFVEGCYVTKNDGTVYSIKALNVTQVPIDNIKNTFSYDLNSFFIKNDGTVWAIGSNYKGQLGIGSVKTDDSTQSITTPTQVIGLTGITKVFSGDANTHSTFFLKNDGTLWGTGDNYSGALGLGTYSSEKDIPVQVPISGVKDVLSQNGTTFFLKSDGTVLGCGVNMSGELGLGNTDGVYAPTLLSITNVKKITYYEGSALFLKNDGTVWASGKNYSGQLGTGNTTDRSTFVQVASNVKDIQTGEGSTSLILKNDGTVWLSGYNNSGVFGLGDKNNRCSFTQFPITNISNVSLGTGGTIVAEKTDGTIWVCGYNSYGALGLGTTTTQTTPVNISTYWVSPVDKATSLVVQAEGSKLQNDVNNAQALVTALQDGTDKTSLQNRLNVVQAYINANTAVIKAESSKMQIDKDSAQTLVIALQDGTDKTNLQNRLNAIIIADTTAPKLTLSKDITDETNSSITITATATDDVAVASITKPDNTVVTGNSVTYKVNTNGTYTFKTTDTSGNVTTQSIVINNIDSTVYKAVSQAESTKTQSDVDSAKSLVNSLPDGTYKTSLENRLSVVQIAINTQNAQNAVVQAGNTTTVTDITKAQTAVNSLPDSTEKTNLQNQLNTIVATQNVTKAESSKTQSDVDSARTLVNSLPSGSDKTTLTQRLDAVQAIIDKANQNSNSAQDLKNAQDAISKVGTTLSSTDVSKAQTAINALPNGTDKTNLQKELDAIKQQIADKQSHDAYNSQLTQATNLITTAESAKDNYAIIKAQSAISSLPNGSDKDALQSRLDALKTQVAKDAQVKAETKEATLKVQIAEASVNLSTIKTYVANAQKAIDNLSAGSDKTALQDRLNKITAQITTNANKSLAMQAEPLVKFAELYKTNKYITQAWTAVNQMTDCQAKTDYVNRLNAIK